MAGPRLGPLVRRLCGKVPFPPDARGGVEQEIGNGKACGAVMIRVVAKLNHVGEGPLPDPGGGDFGLAGVPQALAGPAGGIRNVASGFGMGDVPMVDAVAGCLRVAGRWPDVREYQRTNDPD